MVLAATSCSYSHEYKPRFTVFSTQLIASLNPPPSPLSKNCTHSQSNRKRNARFKGLKLNYVISFFTLFQTMAFCIYVHIEGIILISHKCIMHLEIPHYKNLKMEFYFCENCTKGVFDTGTLQEALEKGMDATQARFQTKPFFIVLCYAYPLFQFFSKEKTTSRSNKTGTKRASVPQNQAAEAPESKRKKLMLHFPPL